MSDTTHGSQPILMRDGERHFSLEEAAARLGVSLATVRRRVADGRLPVLRVASRVLVAERVLEEAVHGGCVVCQHPYRSLVEVQLYEGRPNEDVARRYQIGVGGPGGDLIKAHRAHGHMRPKEDYRGARLLTLREEAEAAAETESGKAALREAREVFAP